MGAILSGVFMWREKAETGKACLHGECPIEDHSAKPAMIHCTTLCPHMKCTIIGDLKEAKTEHKNILQFVFVLDLDFRNIITVAA